MENDLLTRGVEQVMPLELAEEKMRSGKPLRVYLGIDPTGSRLHLGHSVPLRKLAAFAKAGHHAIFLVGNYTAMIGDPTGQEATRTPLTEQQVEQSFRTYKEQASKIIDFGQVEIRHNSEWFRELPTLEFMNIASHFTVQQMMQRDMFRERQKRGEDLSPVEFIYPLMQAYDSVVLDVDCEIGGNDQLFNMLCGRKLQKAYSKREKFVLTTKLLEGLDGRKMSKTYENCVYLTDAPSEMYGKLLALEDKLIPTYMECCTDIPMEEVKQAHVMLSEAARKRGGVEARKIKPLKMRLAREVVTLYHGEDAAKHAEQEFENVFKGKGAPEDMPEVKAEKGSLLVDVLVRHGLVDSKSEARRLIEQGGMKMNDVVVKSVEAKAEEGVVKVGKRRFVRVAFIEE